ncbi:hypothetical protein [Streptosporangium jomthongense]|uniref:PhiRv1 phage protein n=1 Tax=Streptosporangium jomthongense TaxID=1193683 RepID=A0ABV8EWE4_9ACTN
MEPVPSWTNARARLARAAQLGDQEAEERARCDLKAARAEDYIRRLVETAPPLRPEAVERLRALLFSPTTADQDQEDAPDAA